MPKSRIESDHLCISRFGFYSAINESKAIELTIAVDPDVILQHIIPNANLNQSKSILV